MSIIVFVAALVFLISTYQNRETRKSLKIIILIIAGFFLVGFVVNIGAWVTILLTALF